MAHDPEIEIAASARSISKQIDRLLPRADGPESLLADAMRHALLDQGQCFHGYLVCASSELFAVDPYRAMRAAVAAECAFAYSRIHDDLPCMDNVNIRHGRTTVHVEFDEATAILAGDALLSLAFELLADEATHQDPSVRCGLVTGLSGAAGGHGAAGGQLHDLLPAAMNAGIGEVTRLQQMKSGALIAFSCEAGGLLGHASGVARHALRAFAHDLGLAHQIASDIRSLENADGAEKSNSKATFVTVLGLDRARTQAQYLANQSRQHIDIFDNNAVSLNLAVDFISSQCE
jgi:farnesyl diphosphate synthase